MKSSPLRMSTCGWSSLPVPVASCANRPSTNATSGRSPAAASAKNRSRRRLIDPHVLRSPEPEEGQVAVIVTAAQALPGEPVPDGGQRAERERVGDAVALAGV